jgi:hypothetical protein
MAMPRAHLRKDSRRGREHDADPAADHVMHALGPAFVRHVHHLQPRHHLQELAA